MISCTSQFSHKTEIIIDFKPLPLTINAILGFFKFQ